jgi:hypothetical protein
MSYTVQYTNAGKTPITVADGVINHTTSLNLVGRNAAGYGQAIAENFLHLLENTASETPPASPIEGQLWYDTSLPVNKVLKIYDGAAWFPANGVHQASSGPTNKKIGDIWVDTASSQLNIWNGVEWLLIGPTITTGGRNGVYPTRLLDNQGQNASYHNVIISYINDEVITIVSSVEFTPNPVIPGFTKLIPGLNVSTQAFGGVTARLGGLADVALSLKVTANVDPIPADNFLRNDTAGKISGFLNIDSNAGVRIGAVTQTVLLEKQINDAVLSNRVNGGKIKLSVIKDNVLKDIITVDGFTQRVGINHVAPTVELDVNGAGRFAKTVSITSTSSSALSVAGSVIIAENLQAGDSINVINTASIRGKLTVGYLGSTGIAVEPATIAGWDIGSITKPFRTIYANNFSTTSTAFSMVGTGMIMLYAGSVAPDGWLKCDGASKEVSKYPRLYSIIADTYGAVDSSHFNLPDFPAVATQNATPIDMNYIIKY